MFELVSIPYFFEPESSVALKPTIEQTNEPLVALEDRMIDKVFSKRKVAVPRHTQVQDSELASGNEVIVFLSSLII